LEDIVVNGAGGHSKTVIDTIEEQGSFRILCVIDDDVNRAG